MAKKRVKSPTKSVIVRKYLDKNPHATVKETMDAVAAEGTVVSPSLVSFIKSHRKSSGTQRKAQIRNRRVVGRGAGKTHRSRKPTVTSKDLPELLSAKEVDALKSLAKLYVGLS